MDEKSIQQVLAELIEANGQALGTLAAAIAKQIDPERLKSDLQAQISASRSTPGWTPLAERIAVQAVAAAEAETILRRQAKH